MSEAKRKAITIDEVVKLCGDNSRRIENVGKSLGIRRELLQRGWNVTAEAIAHELNKEADPEATLKQVLEKVWLP